MKYLIPLILSACTSLQTAVVPEPSKNNVNTIKVLEVVQASKCKDIVWKDRGKAGIGFINGMSLVYAKHVCTPNEITKSFNFPATTARSDVFSYYPGKSSMRDLFTLMLSAGMFESSGRWCVGRDMSANFNTADSAEAGLFQGSNGFRRVDTNIPILLDKYSKDKSECLLDVFKKGYSMCSDANLKNWGDPASTGYQYQALSKACPVYNVEVNLIGMRKNAREYGPARSGKLEFKTECGLMLEQIEIEGCAK